MDIAAIISRHENLKERQNTEERFKFMATALLIKAGIELDKLELTINGLMKYYSVDRYYHGFSHINWMFDAMYEADWDDMELSLAILFHDVYYVAGCKYNELYSTKMAGGVLRHCCTAGWQPDIVFKLILATAHYMEYNHAFNEKEQRICDLDLSSLAREPYVDFVEQQKSVLLEVGINDLSKSAAFLTSLLEKRGDNLFYTEYAKNSWLSKARSNIERFAGEYGQKSSI